MQREALVSPDGIYRYWLARHWGDGPPMTFVMLNPSTADASIDDPTIRRCIGFARREGCGMLAVVNLYAYRATDPRTLVDAAGAGVDPVGPDNAYWIRQFLASAPLTGALTVAAWGSNAPQGPPIQRLILAAEEFGVTLKCLGTTKAGAPRHPLYVRADQPLVEWVP